MPSTKIKQKFQITISRATAEAVKEGLRDLKAGRVTPAFSTSKEFKKYLKNNPKGI